MLKQWIPAVKPEKEELEKRLNAAQEELGRLQMQIKEHKLPVLVLIEGWGAAGKGSTIGGIIKNIDPRFFKVASMSAPTEEEKRKPFLYRYFVKIPEAGKFEFLDSGWMDEVTKGRLRGELSDKQYAERIESIKRFERQLTDNGYLVLKLFFQIGKKEQKKRLEELEGNKDTAWRVGENDWWQNKHYDKCEEVFDKYLTDTNASVAPWYIIDSGDKKWAELQVLETLCSGIHVALQNESLAVPILQNVFPLVKMPKLSEVELDKEISEEEYKRELRHLQKKLNALHYRLYRKKIPVVIAYEGWTPQARAEISSGSREHWIPEATRYTQSPARHHTRKRDIISGDSGRDCPRPDILPFSTVPGTGALWWSAWKASAAPTTGSGLTMRSMSSRRNCPSGVR